MSLEMKESEGKLDSTGYAEEINKALYARENYTRFTGKSKNIGKVEPNESVDYSINPPNYRDYQFNNVWGTIIALFTFRFFTDNPAYILSIAISGFLMLILVIMILADWGIDSNFMVLRLIVSTVLGVFGIVLFLNFLVCLVRIRNGRIE